MTLTDEQILDSAYAIFLEMAGENLNEQQIALFNAQFAEHGSLQLMDTAENWDEEIGVLIDPEAFAEVWIGLEDANGALTHVFAKVLVSTNPDAPDFHIVW
ncbi:DUF440 family protein [Pasteurellaceae bacterium HPA106]|uniref:HI1450 family dsDNA-mimic protein n=1 Tax=Spirabiliibacterium pneumoniae TaxID=221400 RepID=UPI001AAC8C5F|nr:HI1450 family dsDNA-mimic protein [Spirabiliibacterium pneumoniae]MBE2896501.1 DUF440 family protein [Spirabiliibacterium pneumoniae]